MCAATPTSAPTSWPAIDYARSRGSCAPPRALRRQRLPGGLAREGIPLLARIVAVADSFDAMITDRPYRRAMYGLY